MAKETFCVCRSGAWCATDAACYPPSTARPPTCPRAHRTAFTGPAACTCQRIQLNGFGDAELLNSGEETWGDGKPFAMSRMEILRQGWSGEAAASLEVQEGLNRHQEWVNAAPDAGLEPAFRVGQAHPTQTLNNPENNLLKQLRDGAIRIKTGLERITEHGVVFDDSEEVVEVDCIVLCTGWIFGFEFIDKQVWPEKCGPSEQWKPDNE